MKTWKTPIIESLNVSVTEYSPDNKGPEDGSYTSYDGKFSIPTYGPSAGSSGQVDVEVEE